MKNNDVATFLVGDYIEYRRSWGIIRGIITNIKDFKRQTKPATEYTVYVQSPNKNVCDTITLEGVEGCMRLILRLL